MRDRNKPIDCSGEPESCPDNEGRGCYCSDVYRGQVDLLATTDAAVWAKEFCRLKEVLDWSLKDIDEGLMIAWFSNMWAATNDPLQNELTALREENKRLEGNKRGMQTVIDMLKKEHVKEMLRSDKAESQLSEARECLIEALSTTESVAEQNWSNFSMSLAEQQDAALLEIYQTLKNGLANLDKPTAQENDDES